MGTGEAEAALSQRDWSVDERPFPKAAQVGQYLRPPKGSSLH